jgi:hypothetical protein
MPKQEPETWNDDEINKFLGSRGHTPAVPGAAPTPEGAAAANPTATGYPPRPGVLEQIRGFLGTGAAPTGRPPSYGEMDWQQAAGQGVAREGAAALTGAGRLASKVVPEGVSNFVSEHGGQRLANFADAPAEGPAEYIGSGGLDVALGGMVPSLKLGQLAARALPASRPIWINPLGAGGRWMTQQAYPKARAALRAGGNAAEAAGKGAAAGALTNPDDPAAGAEAGAGAALGGRALGGALRSHTGQEIGGALSRYGIPSGIGYMLGGLPGAGMGGGLGAIAAQVGKAGRHTAHRYYSPLGQSLDRFGRAAFDRTGRFLGYLPATVGAEAGRVSAGNRPTVTVPRRVEPPPPFDIPEGAPNAQPGPPQNQ